MHVKLEIKLKLQILKHLDQNHENKTRKSKLWITNYRGIKIII